MKRERHAGAMAGSLEAARQYLDILEQQTDLISRFLPDGTLLYVNEAYCSFFGRERGEIVGQAWHPVAHPDDTAMVESSLATLSPARPAVVIENRVLAAGGSTRWCQFVNTASFDAKGRILEMQSVGRDVTERKVLELQLAAAARETSDLYDQAPCGYWSLDGNGTIVRINATALAWLGRQRDEVVGRRRITDFVAEEGAARFERLFHEGMHSGAVRDLGCDLVAQDGKRRRISVSASAVRDAAGTFVTSRSVAFDITALRETEERLRALTDSQRDRLDSANRSLKLSQAHVRAIFDSATDAVVTVDRTQTVVDANPAAASMFRLPIDVLVGSPLARLIPTRLREGHGRSVAAFGDEAAGSRAMAADRNVMGLRSDGVEFPVEAAVSRVSIGGEMLCTAILRDISQRLLSQQALRAEKATLEATLASMTDAVCTSDTQGCLVEFNAAYIAFHRCGSRQECERILAGVPSILQMCEADGRPVAPSKRPMARALRGESGSGVEFRLRRSDSGEVWVGSYGFAPIRDAQGRLLGAVVTARDVTDLRRIQAELTASREDLRRLVAERDRAQEDERRRIAMELHDDLQQTLSAIQLDAAAAADRLPEGSQDVRTILEDLQGLVGLTLKSTRRIVDDLRPPALDDLGLVAALKAMVDRVNRHSGLAYAFDAHGIDEARFRPAGSVANCVYRVAQEALTNVAKHAMAGSVDVSLALAGDGWLTLRVQDDGRGIEDAAGAALRSPGLLGMQERARAVGGEVRVTSRPGQGTAVELQVPTGPSA